jgi:transposase-like protein
MKRTRYSKEFKIQVANESIETGNAALVARRYELSPNMVNRWVKEYKEGKFDQDGVQGVSTPLETKKLSQENDQLKRLLGEKDLEIAILRDLIKKKNEIKKRNLQLRAKNRKDFDGKTYNFICKAKRFKLVRAATYTYQNYDRIFGLSSRVPNGVELCIKDINCIKNKQLV